MYFHMRPGDQCEVVDMQNDRIDRIVSVTRINGATLFTNDGLAWKTNRVPCDDALHHLRLRYFVGAAA